MRSASPHLRLFSVMAGVFTRGIASPSDKASAEKRDICRKALSEIFHEDGGQREINRYPGNIVRRRDKRSGGHGRIDAHSLQDDGHEGRHTGGYKKCSDKRGTDDHTQEALMPNPSDQ